MNEEKGFKTSLVGGFDREDVLQYIERTAKESAERVATLQQEAELLRDERDELREKNEALSQKNADLLERLGEMTVAEEAQQGALADARREAEEAGARAGELDGRAQALETENSALHAQTEELAARCAAYDEDKERIAEIELAAHRRAKEIEERAQFESRRVRVQSAEVVGALRRELQAVCASYQTAAAQAERTAADNKRRADELEAKLELVVSTLDEVVVGELQSDAPDAPERPRMQQILDMLRGRDGE